MMATVPLSTLQTLQAELQAWQETARQEARNKDYYRELLNMAARHLGPDVFVADDGSVMDEPLRAKVPELVQRLKIQRDAAHEEANNSLEELEQAEALVGQAIKMLRELIEYSDHDEECRQAGFPVQGAPSCLCGFQSRLMTAKSLLADPLGARLVEEQRALDGLLQAAKTTIRLGSSGVFHGTGVRRGRCRACPWESEVRRWRWPRRSFLTWLLDKLGFPRND